MDDSGPIRGLLLDSGDTLIRPIGGESFPGRASHASIATRAIHPAHHILGVRRELFEQQPDVAREIYEAVEQSKLHWISSRGLRAETTPWLLAEIQVATALIGDDWSPRASRRTD